MARRVLRAAVALTSAAAATLASAQSAERDYPARPVHIVVPIAPGGGVDTMARTLAPLLASRLGQSVVVDNRAGGGGSVGAMLTAQATADGYTAMITSSSFVLHTLLYKASYDVARDFSPVTQLVQHPYVMLVAAGVPAGSVREFIDWAKASPGAVNYASSGNGSLIHLTGALFNSVAGTRMVHIPYKGIAQSFPDMLAGRVQATFTSILTGLPQISSGRLKALGVTSLQRTARLPDVPTLAEAGLGQFEVTQWYGVFAPAHTPAARLVRLESEIAAILKSPEMSARIAQEGSRAVGSTGAEFARVIAIESNKWRQLVAQAGIKAE
jgi:tripartite-type tricarboxylate transporter receptor subunit TctC